MRKQGHCASPSGDSWEDWPRPPQRGRPLCGGRRGGGDLSPGSPKGRAGRGAHENGPFSSRRTNSELENRRDARMRTRLTPLRALSTDPSRGYADAPVLRGGHTAHVPPGPAGGREATSPVGAGPSGAGTPLPAQYTVTRAWSRRLSPGLERASHGPRHAAPRLSRSREARDPVQTARGSVPHAERPHALGRRPLLFSTSPQAMAAVPTTLPVSQSASPSSKPAEARARPPTRGTVG